MTHKTFNQIGRFLDRNSPYILTGVAITGVITTVFFAVEATPKAMRIIAERKCQTKKEIIKATWKCYIPAAISGLVTIGSIVTVNSINQRRTAALAGLYSLAQTSLKEYREKVIDIIGENKERKIRDEVDHDKVLANPTTNIIVTGSGDVLCYDSLTGRYFTSDIEKIRKIVNELNRNLLTDMFIPLNDFFYEIGLDSTELGNNLGFDIDKGLFEIKFSSQLTKEERPCLVLNYEVYPKYSQ